jgi:hypothetical protein
MKLPEEEKAVLTDSVLNLQGGLNNLDKLINGVGAKVMKLHRFVEAQQRLPAPGELQEQLNDIIHAIEIVQDNGRDLDGYAVKARNIVDATMIVGVLFFLTLTSLVETGLEGEMGAKLGIVILTATVVVPFSISAITSLQINANLRFDLLSQREDESFHRMIGKRYQDKPVRFAISGFGYLITVLFFIALSPFLPSHQLIPILSNPAQQCGVEPERFGINETDIWQCSMFSENSLAGQCVIKPSRFNMSLSECHEFIAPSDPTTRE